MAVSYDYAKRFVGQPVMVHCAAGQRYCGIVQHCTPHTLYLVPFRNSAAPVSDKSNHTEIVSADQTQDMEVQNVQWYGYGGYGYGAGLALPLFAILALTPFFFW